MGQFFGFENITKLQKDSTTQVSLPSGSYLRIGGQARALDTALTCITSTSGFGGIDTGSIAISSFYYVYAVINGGGTVGLVASLSATAPTGFAAYRKIGAFYTESGTTNIFKAYWLGEINVITSSSAFDMAGLTVTNQSQTWLGSSLTLDTTGTASGTFVADTFSVAPNITGTPQNTGDTSSRNNMITFRAITTATFKVSSMNGASTAENRNGWLHVSKRGLDAIQPDWT